MTNHKSVLLSEAIAKMAINPDGIYIDATLGFGGHSLEIAKHLSVNGQLLVFEQDSFALKKAQKNLAQFENIKYFQTNFKNLATICKQEKINEIDGILYDLGTSYYQLTTQNRGFSYHGEAELDMRMDQRQKLSAKEIINTYSVEDLARIFRDYGDERQAWKLANEIVKQRLIEPLTTNTELVTIIKKIKGYNKDKHPAKNIFQALRIEVNDEIGVLKHSLSDALKLLKPGGVCLVITFHSLEDRTVKHIFWEAKNRQIITEKANIKFFKTQKTIYPTKLEIIKNNSARSAKLRIIKKI